MEPSSHLPTRPTQEFAPRCGQEIAAEAANIHRHLANRLTRIQQVRNAMLPRDLGMAHGAANRIAVFLLYQTPVGRKGFDVFSGYYRGHYDHQ